MVNCVQENPLYPVLASSGIDYDIKIWQPILREEVDISSKVEMVFESNFIINSESQKISAKRCYLIKN